MDAARATGRITSLDAVRGVMLAWSVTSDSVIAPASWYDHAVWDSVHPVDVVFPIFVTLSGCGLAFAYRRRIQVGPMLRRALVLTVAGLLYTLVVVLVGDGGWTGWPSFRLTGVLQLYAGVVLLVALGHLVTRTARGWAVITLLLAATHTALLSLWARGCPSGALTPECNPSRTIDTAVLSAGHLYRQGTAGHDPEGLVALLGACASAGAGAAVGHALLSARQRGTGPSAASLPVLGLATGLLLAGLAASTLVPPMKRLWTAPFALAVAALVAVALLLVHLALDRAERRPALDAAAWPLLALGRNSLLVYFGSHLLMAVLTRVRVPGGEDSLAVAGLGALGATGHPQVAWSALSLALWVGLACLLHRRGLYLRP